MSFEYPKASKSIQLGNGFYRIRAESTDSLGTDLTAVAPGDLIPINAGFSALVVGPDSDYERYELLYPDKTAPGGVQRIPFSVGAPLIGNIGVDPSNSYLKSNDQSAQAYIRVVDNGSFWDYTGFAAPEKCVTDILVYTGQVPPILPMKRAPRVLRSSPDMPTTTHFVIPGYGRRSFCVSMASPTQNSGVANLTTLDAYIYGVKCGWELNNSTSAQASDTNAKVYEQDVHTSLLGRTGGGDAVAIDMLAPVQNFPGPSPRGAPDRINFGYDAVTGGYGYFDFYHVTLDMLPSPGVPLETNFFNGPFLSMEVRD